LIFLVIYVCKIDKDPEILKDIGDDENLFFNAL